MTSASKYIGKEYTNVRKEVKNIRVLKRDGELFAGTTEFRRDRLNVHIEKGIIKFAYFG